MADHVVSGETNNDAPSPSVVAHTDLTYAKRDAGDMKLDLYVPDTEGAIPLVVYIHGGGWVFETRKNAPTLKQFAAEWECAMASVSYRLAEVPEGVELAFSIDPENQTPKGVFPDQIVDVKAAIRWLRSNDREYGFETSAVATWGASAGGHLAALAGTIEDIRDMVSDSYPDETVEPEVAPDASGNVQAVIDWYGISDLHKLSGKTESVEALMLGGPVAENPERARQASPVTHVTTDAPPFLIMHGQNDEVVPVRQSRTLFEELAAHGVDTVFYELQNLGHVWGADSERTAMEILKSDPQLEHSFTATPHVNEEMATNPIIDDDRSVGPGLIKDFLERTL